MKNADPFSPDPSPAHNGGEDSPLTIVGLGASAGGLDALRRFFQAVKPESGMAYVVIQHLDPERESHVRELLQGHTAIPLHEVTSAVRVEPDNAYLLSPRFDLLIDHQELRVSERAAKERKHAPIDLFFRSLAEAQGPAAVGVVLSGTGSDGSLGLRWIKERGGVTVAQAPKDAEHDGMPRSAIAAGHVDLVLPAPEIPAALLRLKRSRPALPFVETETEAAPQDAEELLTRLFAKLRARTGHDFSHYKRPMLLRRLGRRIGLTGTGSLSGYLEYLSREPEEMQRLLGDFLISVSSFFRDPQAFHALEQVVVPALIEGKGVGDQVRVWVPGCATGEEAYSLAILLTEHVERIDEPPEIQIFASDIDEHAFGFAREALYRESIADDVSAERLRRCFDPEPGGFRVKKHLRDLLVFASHDVLRDPPFSRLDLIACRNVLIYLLPDPQKHLLELFHYALRPDGWLFVGTSETVDGDLFAEIDKKSRLYRRTSVPHPVIPRLGWVTTPRTGTARGEGAGGPGAVTSAYGQVHLRLFEAFGPPSVLVNTHLDVVHLSERASRYLRLRGGELSRNLLDLVPEELRSELRTAAYQAFQHGTPVTRAVRVEIEGEPRDVQVSVCPLRQDKESAVFAIVLFEEHAAPPAAAKGPERARGQRGRAVVAELEQELRRTREQLEAMIQDRDATIEELQSSNEELQSMNEELSATTEELETSREELQSINEELKTINQEHRAKIEELAQTNADLQSLMAATEIPTIFLDRQLRIRRFTPPVAKLFNVVGHDVGRPLDHVTHKLDYPELGEDAEQVLTALKRVSREVRSEDGSWYIARLAPYRTADDRIAGVVATFVDLTERKRIEEELVRAKTAAEDADHTKAAFLATMSHELRTPLNAIVGYADLLSTEVDGPLLPDQQAKLERIKLAARHLVSIIEEILQFSEPEPRRAPLHVESADAVTLAREAAAIVEQSALDKHLGFRVEVPEAPLDLNTDKARLRKVLVNLLINAVKFTGVGEVVMAVQPRGAELVFEVRDTGIGISAEHQTHIFEPFWQGAVGPWRRAGGTGLGLTIARQVTHELGGEIEVESVVGRGSTFRVRVPT